MDTPGPSFTNGQSKEANKTHSDFTANYIRQLQMQIERCQTLIAERQHDLDVYIHARKLLDYPNERKKIKSELDKWENEKCLVFVGDNYFVERTRTEGRLMLDRQIEVKKKHVTHMEHEKTLLTRRLDVLNSVQTDMEGIVEIQETEQGPLRYGEKRRIAHKPKVPTVSKTTTIPGNDSKSEVKSTLPNVGLAATQSSDSIKRDSPEDILRPQGVSSKDFEEFVKIMNELDADEEEEDESELSTCEEEPKEESDSPGGTKVNDVSDTDNKPVKKVQFAGEEELGPESIGQQEDAADRKTPKSILLNKGEKSPIDMEAVVDIKEREESKLVKIVPVSNKVFKDEIMERNTDAQIGIDDSCKENDQPASTKRPKSKFASRR
ncbi:hypothetical protein DdX_11338 [Ditylenchus destructor]|uniref:Uncharacterized protein n=1 Tax=Ditylenchus destructor TaxID=166010 RepID=A0AAD4R4M2_9BILA|nr:hypothetical protein DdX_11338 [Ditylenchus destructor]